VGRKLHVDQPAGFVHTLIDGIAQNLLLISLPSPSSDTLLVFHAHPPITGYELWCIKMFDWLVS